VLQETEDEEATRVLQAHESDGAKGTEKAEETAAERQAAAEAESEAKEKTGPVTQ